MISKKYYKMFINIKRLFKGKIDAKNSGLKKYLNIGDSIQLKIEKFQTENIELSKETISQYFDEYKALFNFAQAALVELRNKYGETNLTRLKFISVISSEYKWVNDANMNRLYNVCSFYLK